MTDHLQAIIEAGWDRRESVDSSDAELARAVETAISALDAGEARIAEKIDGAWVVHQWLKKAVLLSFRMNPMEAIAGGPDGAPWRGHHGRYLGDGRQLRPDRQERPYLRRNRHWRRARAVAGRPGDHRG